jgi:hypothetical protein
MWKFNDRIPDAMRACMGLIPVPDDLPYPPTDQGRTRLEADLKDKCKIVVNPSITGHGRLWLRIAAQVYNGIRDYEQLGSAVFGLR